MNEDLIRRWNSVVSKDDTVYVLGDMFWCNVSQALPVLDQLNGKKILVKGNHDRCNDSKFRSKFERIADYLEIEDNGRRVVLCHYPIVCFKNHFYGWYHLYGHVHTSFEWNMMESVKCEMTELYGKQCNMYNCGVMLPYMNYTPRTLDEIIEGAK
jgi:calcineurin-like phosphoesterase family protein